MSTASEQTIQLLEEVVNELPVGTNLGLLHLMWGMMSGAFLKSRGAIFTALFAIGLAEDSIRRGWAAMRYGVWSVDELIIKWTGMVERDGHWEENSYEGYKPVAADMVIFWRPKLKGWLGKFYCGITGRGEKGVGFGVIVRVGKIGEQRIPLIRKILRAKKGKMNDKDLKQQMLAYGAKTLGENEVLIHDAGASTTDMQEAEVARYVVRQAKNCTARQNKLPARKKKGRKPEYGNIVRPVKRQYNGKVIHATKPDFKMSFKHQGRKIKVKGWHQLVRSNQKVDEVNDLFSILVFDDPSYKKPLVLAYNFEEKPETIFWLYLDRWSVEQVPLAAKQMMGMGRQFVFANTSCHRLPELSLFVGNMLTYLAATLPPLSTGFWDRHPKRTPGRLRRTLEREGFPKEYPFNGRIRVKQSVTVHLPKGIEGHRRVKTTIPVIST